MNDSPSQDGFNNLWKKVIFPEINRYITVDNVSATASAEKEIWEAYKEFNMLCKRDFMSESVEKLDRHKIAACYIYAIVKTQPLSMKTVDLPQNMVVTINEHLAITVGMSILHAYMKDSDPNFSSNDLIFPHAQHGNYRDDFALELYYTKKYNMYNILSLSNTLFLLEMYNLALPSNK